ncbi:NADH-cytochrome b5 reductase-like [Littorina saxatilis]|uniref:NADH-cytochrome b5 reductase n=1 Tax=Littorina saxatilis TaxID=31220 RepID=A0AAN9G9B4_9CAEN
MDTQSTLAMEGLPQKPEKPLDSDCCGNGCVPCVLDIYAEELAIWERECARIKSGGTSHSVGQEEEENGEYESPALSSSEYHQYQITAVIPETHDTWRFTCRLGPDQSLGLLPGQHVVIRGYVEGKPITRQYTPVSDVRLKGAFHLLIKVYRDGRMSQVVRTCQVGDGLEIRGPFGCLQYTPNQYSRVLMLAAGTGVAPMAQLIQAMLTNEDEEGRVRLLYACRTYHDILMKSEIAEWRQFWNFSATFLLSQEPPTETPSGQYQYGEEIVHGKINKTLLEKELGKNVSGTRVLVCGTRSFDSDMLQILDVCNFPKDHIFKF